MGRPPVEVATVVLARVDGKGTELLARIEEETGGALLALGTLLLALATLLEVAGALLPTASVVGVKFGAIETELRAAQVAGSSPSGQQRPSTRQKLPSGHPPTVWVSK